jgi:site-specific recombinase XerC
MKDSFSASIEGYHDWLPCSGKRKSASTIMQYTRSAEQLGAWVGKQGRQGFGELTRADLRAAQLGCLDPALGGRAHDQPRSA